MDIRKGNDVNVYFELSKLGVPSAESVKGIRCFFAKDVRSESGDVPVPPSLNPSSYVIHDHMHPGYNVHMPYRSITLHVHREFSVPDNCPPGWHGQTVFVVTDYKIVNIEKEGETVPYLRVAFGGDKQRNGRYNIVLEIVYVGTDDQGRSDVKCTYDYGHQFDLTDQITALSGRVDIWLTDQKDIYTKVEELENNLVQEISRSTEYDERVETAILGIHGSIDDLQDETEDLYGKYSDQEEEIGDLLDRATELENVVPQEASALNKLADKDYVNQHISESSATFRGTSAKNLTEQQFLSWANTLEKENNDYVFWDTVDGDSDTIFKRYKYNGQQWLYEYTITSNNFTPTLWAAINSGLTSTDKTKLTELPTASSLTNTLNTKANVGDLAAVATSGSYNDLQDKPTINTVEISSYIGGQQLMPDAGTYTYNNVTISPIRATQADDLGHNNKYLIYPVYRYRDQSFSIDIKIEFFVFLYQDDGTDAGWSYSDTWTELPGWMKSATAQNVATATTTSNGLMSSGDKSKLDSIDGVYVAQSGELNLSNPVHGVDVDAYKIDATSTHDVLIKSVNGDVAVEADGEISLETNEGAISVTSGDGAVSITSGPDHAIILTSDGGVTINIGNTSLWLDESKLQRLAQLLA